MQQIRGFRVVHVFDTLSEIYEIHVEAPVSMAAATSVGRSSAGGREAAARPQSQERSERESKRRPQPPVASNSSPWCNACPESAKNSSDLRQGKRSGGAKQSRGNSRSST